MVDRVCLECFRTSLHLKVVSFTLNRELRFFPHRIVLPMCQPWLMSCMLHYRFVSVLRVFNKKQIALRTLQEAYSYTGSSIFTGFCIFVHLLTVRLAICTARVETHTDNIHRVWPHFIHMSRVTNFTILTWPSFNTN